jgi:hypothetical protein
VGPVQRAWLAREIEERFLRCVDRLLRRSEGGEKASAHFGRNDPSGWAVVVSGKIRWAGRKKQIPHPLKKRGFGMTGALTVLWWCFGGVLVVLWGCVVVLLGGQQGEKTGMMMCGERLKYRDEVPLPFAQLCFAPVPFAWLDFASLHLAWFCFAAFQWADVYRARVSLRGGGFCGAGDGGGGIGGYDCFEEWAEDPGV